MFAVSLPEDLKNFILDALRQRLPVDLPSSNYTLLIEEGWSVWAPAEWLGRPLTRTEQRRIRQCRLTLEEQAKIEVLVDDKGHATLARIKQPGREASTLNYLAALEEAKEREAQRQVEAARERQRLRIEEAKRRREEARRKREWEYSEEGRQHRQRLREQAKERHEAEMQRLFDR